MNMRLKELELDLPYCKNEEFIRQIQENENIKYTDAVKQDYRLNWKQKRRDFQLMTRSMTSFVERVMKPVDTKDCWKIVIECVDGSAENGFKNLLGVYCIQIEFEFKKFQNLDVKQKK